MINSDNNYMNEADFSALLADVFKQNGIEKYATEENLHKFYQFACILREENAKYNLTSILSDEGIALLHFADSLAAADLIPAGASMLDVGAGPGFPSLPIAIVRPDVSVCALDATKKKTDFIAATAQKLGLDNVKVINDRAESDKMREKRESFDFVTARAVAGLGVICELALPYAKVGGKFAALKGENADEELKGAQSGAKKLSARIVGDEKSQLVYKTANGATSNTRRIIIFEKLSPTPSAYPRAYAKIKRSPLF